MFPSPALRRSLTLLLAAPALVFAQAPSVNQSIDNVLGDHVAYEAAIRSLQKAVAEHDAAGVAALVNYPIRVSIGKRKTLVRDAKAFVAAYDKIVTPAIAEAIKTQKYDELMVNAQGVMFGSGQVWINGICSDKACTRSTPKVVTIQSAP
jgi:hypothetical protein